MIRPRKFFKGKVLQGFLKLKIWNYKKWAALKTNRIKNECIKNECIKSELYKKWTYKLWIIKNKRIKNESIKKELKKKNWSSLSYLTITIRVKKLKIFSVFNGFSWIRNHPFLIRIQENYTDSTDPDLDPDPTNWSLKNMRYFQDFHNKLAITNKDNADFITNCFAKLRWSVKKDRKNTPVTLTRW